MFKVNIFHWFWSKISLWIKSRRATCNGHIQIHSLDEYKTSSHSLISSVSRLNITDKFYNLRVRQSLDEQM
jgi:hypothetical protein